MARIRPEWCFLLGACGGPATPPPEPACEATWQGFGEAWFRSWCTSCHSSALPEADRFGAPVGVDFDTLQGVSARAASIRAVATGADPAMPPGGGPTAEERAELEAWLDCGLPGTDAPPAPRCEEAAPRVGDARADAATCADGPIEVEGALLVEEDVELSCVCAVGGDLVVGERARRVALGELRALGGSVRIPAAAALEELDVRSLQQVGGSLAAADVPALAAVRTASLREVGGSFRLERLPALGEVDLSRLETVGGAVVIDDLPSVRVLQGEGYALREVGGDLVLRGMPSWRGFYGFGQLRDVPGDLVIAENDGLTRLDGFTALRSVGGALELGANASLRHLDGFDQLASVGGDLVLAHHPALEVEDTFAMLATVGGELRLEDDPKLAVRGALTRIVDVGSLVVDGLPQTPSLDLSSLASCDGDLVLARAGVTSFLRPLSLASVGGDLVLTENPRLATLPGWAELASVGGDLVVTGNPALPAAAAAEVAAGVGSVGGAVDVRDNGP